MQNITIRTAESADIQSVYALICELESEKLDNLTFQQCWNENLTQPNIYYFVAVTDDKVIGFLSLHLQILLHHCSKVAEIQELIVCQNHRNHQVGKKLFEQAEEVARFHQCSVLEVTCSQKRVEAHRFYEQKNMRNTHFKFVKSLQS